MEFRQTPGKSGIRQKPVFGPVPGGLVEPRTFDRIERYVPLALRLCVYALLTTILVQASVVYFGHDPGLEWPMLIWMIRTFIFLPLHEGGHFISMFFGKTLYILGGSFWQVMFPFIWFLIAIRQRSHAAPFALFWAGENLMDVSLYIRDAPYRALPLLGGDKSGHDWGNLFTQWDAMDMAGVIGDWAYFVGLFICAAAILGGAAWAIAVSVRGVPTRERLIPADHARIP